MKILVLTTIYPSPGLKITNSTEVVHYFAKEWVKQGHEVVVVYNYPVYLRVFHWIASTAAKSIASTFNTSVTSTYVSEDHEYEMDGVTVMRMPLFKPFPHGKVPRRNMARQIEKIHAYCRSRSFVPDAITSHNFYPHLEMVNALKERYYRDARTCVVVHIQDLRMLRFVDHYKAAIGKVDVWGYRSAPIRRRFEQYVGTGLPHFMCHSGIPAHFLHGRQCSDLTQPISRFVYVGSFLRRKHPEKLLSALKQAAVDDFTLTYVGDGERRRVIERMTAENGWVDRVVLTGRVERAKVPELLAQAQCFIMVSEQETFGLVYLEAMSMGLITIASRDEGMEGIIVDGVNGFLCRAGDDVELAAIITKIRSLSPAQIARLSSNARRTALRHTDATVAAHYAQWLSPTTM